MEETRFVFIQRDLRLAASPHRTGSPHDPTVAPPIHLTVETPLLYLLEVHVLGERLLEHVLQFAVDLARVLVALVLDEVHDSLETHLVVLRRVHRVR